MPIVPENGSRFSRLGLIARDQLRRKVSLELVHPDDRAAYLAAYLDAFTRRGLFEAELRLRRADGVYRWAIDAAAPRFGPGGEFLGYVGSVIDIDERRGGNNERVLFLVDGE